MLYERIPPRLGEISRRISAFVGGRAGASGEVGFFFGDDASFGSLACADGRGVEHCSGGLGHDGVRVRVLWKDLNALSGDSCIS